MRLDELPWGPRDERSGTRMAIVPMAESYELCVIQFEFEGDVHIDVYLDDPPAGLAVERRLDLDPMTAQAVVLDFINRKGVGRTTNPTP